MGVLGGNGIEGSGGVALVVGGLAEPTDDIAATADASTHALIRCLRNMRENMDQLLRTAWMR